MTHSQRKVGTSITPRRLRATAATVVASTTYAHEALKEPSPGSTMPATTTEFLRSHSLTNECSSVYHFHRNGLCGNFRCCVELGYAFLKSLSANNFYWLAVDTSNVGSPLTRFPFKCLHVKSLVLHE